MFFDKFNNPIKNGTFSIVEFAVSAYTKPTKYVTLISKIKDSKKWIFGTYRTTSSSSHLIYICTC